MHVRLKNLFKKKIDINISSKFKNSFVARHLDPWLKYESSIMHRSTIAASLHMAHDQCLSIQFHPDSVVRILVLKGEYRNPTIDPYRVRISQSGRSFPSVHIS